jgi:hypothetical protein
VIQTAANNKITGEASVRIGVLDRLLTALGGRAKLVDHVPETGRRAIFKKCNQTHLFVGHDGSGLRRAPIARDLDAALWAKCFPVVKTHML